MISKKDNKQRRLSFLVTFLRAIGIKVKTIPETIISPGALHMAIFSSDDTHLSVIRKIVENYGFKLSIRLIPRKQLGVKSNVKYNNYNPDKTLYFLRKFLSISGLTCEGLAQTVGLTRDAVTYWFKKDDITVSRLYYLAHKTDSELFITIFKEGLDTNHKSTVTTSVIINDRSIINKSLLKHAGEDE